MIEVVELNREEMIKRLMSEGWQVKDARIENEEWDVAFERNFL